ncbi:MAG: O-antigen ligase family protein, partial [Verrucomicrobiales bacterium]
QVRHLALAFICAIAAYAVVSKFMQGESVHGSGSGAERFGILPNRNHSAFLLAMGVVAGLGCILQAMREKRWFGLAVALVATVICAWATAVWSISRAGILLAAVGAVVWLPLMGWTYLGRNGRWAVVLLVAAFAGAFALTDSVVKQRISKTIASPTSIEADQEAGQNTDLTEALLDKDFRVPTALDAFDLIREQPWTGVGAGQFRYIFPQYRVRSSVHNHTQHFHPESDWLWIATEFGIPAAVFLLLAVVLALSFAARGVMRGRERAVRAACLAAAALLPIHGLIDVPGHRIGLALAAAWLFSLALHSRPEGVEESPVDASGRAPAWRRLWALPVLLIAGWMIWLQGGGNGGALMMASDAARKEVAKWMEIDKEAREKASQEGKFFSPPEEEDPLVQALAVLEQAVLSNPLDPALRREQGFVAIFFDNRYDLVRSAFAIERSLDPSWVGCAVEQSQIWACALPEESESLWDVAMGRAEKIGKLDADAHWGPSQTWQSLSDMVRREPALKPRWDLWAAENPRPE